MSIRIVPCRACESMVEVFGHDVKAGAAPCGQLELCGTGIDGRFRQEDIPEIIAVLQRFVEREGLNGRPEGSLSERQPSS